MSKPCCGYFTTAPEAPNTLNGMPGVTLVFGRFSHYNGLVVQPTEVYRFPADGLHPHGNSMGGMLIH